MRMRLIAISLLVVWIAALGMAGCSKGSSDARASTAAQPATASNNNAAQAALDRRPVIAAFGDSLTAGQGVVFERNYPSQLQKELDRLGYAYHIVNAGVSGDTTSSGLNRVESVLKQEPEIVILELGANDGLRGQPIALMKKNLISIIERLQAAKIKVILAGMQIPPNYGEAYTAAFQQVFIDLAAQYKLPLIPFFLDGVAAHAELNQADGIHPTAEGYVYVVRNVRAVLEPLLHR